jgi:glutamate formiminotransferase / 5-formyltetrahydrofolate cyclo-ligase
MGDDASLRAVARLVECVPNVSEGRRRDVIEGLAKAIRDVPGVRLLDQTSDLDHNRSVFTFAGDADAVTAAAHALITSAYLEIDMRSHKGEHPRLGAVDVVPFVPLAGVTMEECVAVAHAFGREIAERHGVPVYFYARAATRPERIRLPDIRKPQYEGLADLLATTHIPDVGPAVLHPQAGAIVIGARPPLIAFNIELDTADLKIAKRIAKEIRESSGGLPAVQALGFELTDPPRAQVSMNLLDTSQTSLATVWREVETRATAAGVRILRGELIGLLPLDAALQVTASALKLEKFERSRVIESHFLE